jgi:hypothetical protein
MKAIQSIANINREQMKQLRSCLIQELGSPVFASQYKISQIVNLECVEPFTGVYKYGSERIPWSYKPIEKVVELWLETQFQQDPVNMASYEQIDVDHGKGYSRISANFIARWKDKDDHWCESSSATSLENARCKNDKAEQNGRKYIEDFQKGMLNMLERQHFDRHKGCGAWGHTKK